MTRNQLIGLVISLVIANTCLADLHISLDLDQTHYQDSFVDTQPSVVSIGLSYAFNKRFSLLGKYGTGYNRETTTTMLSGSADIEVDHLGGIYFNTVLLKNKSFNPYATLGYSSTKLIAQFNEQSIEQSENGFSYGIGLEYKISRSFSANLEVLNLINNSDAEMNTANLGIRYAW